MSAPPPIGQITDNRLIGGDSGGDSISLYKYSEVQVWGILI